MEYYRAKICDEMVHAPRPDGFTDGFTELREGWGPLIISRHRNYTRALKISQNNSLHFMLGDD